MAKYLIALIVLIVAGGVFLYSTQTAQAPTAETPQETENPFGEGANTVGPLDRTTTGATDGGAASGSTNDPGTGTGGTGSGSGSTGGTTAGVISRAELATHNTQADCWVGYKGVVYDVTNWLPRHPGSAGAIAPYCGTAEEFAAAFNRKHGTSKEGRLQKEGVNEGTLGN